MEKNSTKFWISNTPQPLSMIDTSSNNCWSLFSSLINGLISNAISGFNEFETLQAATELSINSLQIWNNADWGVPNPLQ